MMKKGNKNPIKLSVNILLVVFLIVLYLVIRTQTGIITKKSQELLIDNWSVTINGVSKGTQNLRNFSFPVTNIGDSVELTTTLPDSAIPRPTMQFHIYHSIINVYVDGQKIYTFTKDHNHPDKMIGSGYHWLELPEDYAGKELKIYFDVTEDNAFSSIKDIAIMSESNVSRNFILRNILEIVIGVSLFVFGVLLFLVVIFLEKIDRETRILFWISFFSTSFSLWILCTIGILQLVFQNIRTVCRMEYLSLYFAPIPLLLFIYDIEDNKKAKKIFSVLTSVMVIFFISAIILDGLNICHLPKVLSVFHILGASAISIIIISSIVTRKQQDKKSGRIILYALVVLLLFLFADILRFNVNKYFYLKNMDLSNSILPIGILTFILFMLASYIHRLILVFYENAEKQTLIQIAYTDALTKVGNRAMCEKLFQERESAKKDTTIINFDLNHFKQVNDIFGHSVGDMLLVEFAQILQENYKKDGFVGRVGGDEFIAILDRTDKAYIESTITSLLDKIDKLNKKENRDYQISVAYGFCTTEDDSASSLWQIYQNSDKKMYQNKTENR